MTLSTVAFVVSTLASTVLLATAPSHLHNCHFHLGTISIAIIVSESLHKAWGPGITYDQPPAMVSQ